MSEVVARGCARDACPIAIGPATLNATPNRTLANEPNFGRQCGHQQRELYASGFGIFAATMS
jgi:hypothetical protein